MAEKYQQQVVKIERHEGETGPFLMVTTKKKDGSFKERKVFGELAQHFTVPGKYTLGFDKTTHYLVSAQLLEAQNGGGQPVAQTGAGNLQQREIRGAVILKAAVEYFEALDISERIPLATCFSECRDLLEAYIENKPAAKEPDPF